MSRKRAAHINKADLAWLDEHQNIQLSFLAFDTNKNCFARELSYEKESREERCQKLYSFEGPNPKLSI